MKKSWVVLVILLSWSCTLADVLHVPSVPYAGIQSAIDDAGEGDVIIVAKGTYRENIDFLGKAVTVRSTDPNDRNVVTATVIDGSNPAHPNIGSVATFISGEDGSSTLSGFTIQNGTGQSDPCGASWYWKGTNGGGVFCRGASPTITKNVFRNCTAEYGGGAIYCHNGASPIITENTFIDNYAGWYAGAIFARLRCSPTISNNRLTENQCRYLGGAIYLADQSYSKIVNNYIQGNSSAESGGGIYYFVNSAPTIACNLVVSNSSKVTGSAIMAGGGATGLIVNNLFMDNKLTRASVYGAALGTYANPTIANNIIITNQGNGIYLVKGAAATIRNNDVWNNALADYAGSVTDQTGINGNISLDPHLAALLPEPFTIYELEPNSPCRDAGSNADLPAWLAADYDDTARIANAVVDIGPQEYKAIAVPQDYDSIQEAIDNAVSGDEIIVLPGLYQENINFLGKNITLRSLNPLDPNCVEKTIIDGNDLASCITLESGENKQSIIAGFTIQNGHGEFGGGIYIADNAGATILYNHVRNNKADRYGGGIDTRHYSDTAIEHNRVEKNYAGAAGGGIHVGARANCRIFRNYIAQNQAPSDRQGGGIYCYNWANVDIIENEISLNRSSSGGAIYTWKTNGTIKRNHIWGNYARTLGGAIVIKHAFGTPSSKMSIVNNLIQGNKTDGSGGAILLRLGATNIINNTIASNVSNSDSGAGIAVEGAAYANIINNIIAHNLGGSGIRLLMPWDPNLLIEPNTVANDLWNNEAGNYTGELTDQTGINRNISADPCFVDPGRWDANSTPTDTSDDYWVPGNYRIGYYSSCRDRATSVNAPDNDIDQNPRPHFTGTDIGAYELQIYDMTATGSVDFTDLALLADDWLTEGPPTAADLDNNGIVDFRDFALLAESWLL